MEDGWELTSELTSKWITFEILNKNLPLISLITSEVLAQILQNLQGSRWNNVQWCLQNYMEDDWELTSELTVPAELHSKRLRIDVWIDV